MQDPSYRHIDWIKIDSAIRLSSHGSRGQSKKAILLYVSIILHTQHTELSTRGDVLPGFSVWAE